MYFPEIFVMREIEREREREIEESECDSRRVNVIAALTAQSEPWLRAWPRK